MHQVENLISFLCEMVTETADPAGKEINSLETQVLARIEQQNSLDKANLWRLAQEESFLGGVCCVCASVF